MAAEERSRIEFGNNIIQEQAVWQIFETIVIKKKPKDELLSERNHSLVKELEILWDKCTEPSLVTSLAAARVLVELVSQNIAEFNYVMNNFLNRTTSANQLPGPIHGITKLLCLQRNFVPGLYSLSSNPHPYVSILANSPEVWSVLFQEIENVFENQRSSLKSTLSIFEPFFKHVLLNPKTDYALSRALHSLLLNVASEVQTIADQDALDSILNLVTNHLSLFKKTMTSLGHHVSLCHNTLRWILIKHEGLFEKHTKRLTILLLEMCHEQLSVGHSMLSSLLLLNKIAKVKPWILITDGTMFLISQLLLTCSQTYHEQLVKIAFKISSYIITSSPSHKNKLCFLVLPLLQILATSTNMMSDRRAIQSLSVQLMSNVEKTLNEEHPVDTCPEESSAELFSLPGNWFRRMSMCENVFQFVQSRKDPALIKWLEGVESSLSDSNIDNQDFSWISLLLSAFLIKSSENAAVHVLNVITTLCKVDPTQAPYFLPLLLFKIERSFSSDLKLQILYTIPKLATHKFCVKNVLGTLLVLNNTAGLKAVSLRLMFKLWQRQPRVFTKLLKLIEEKSLSLSRDALVELQWTRAVTIRDICRERPTQHGKDLVRFINEILNENVHLKSKENIVLVCLVLEALQALVSAEVIDILSVWETFTFKLEHSHNLLVLRNLCDFFSIVPSVAVDSQKYQEFKEHVLTFLWRNALHENASVVGSAFNGLGEFDVVDFILGNLPNKLRQSIIERLKSTPKIKRMLKQAEKEEKEIDFDGFPIPGYFYVELLQRTNILGNPAFEKFLQNVVEHEVAGLPRGLTQTTMKQEETLESKTMASVPVLMKTQYDKCKQPFLKPSMAASLLFCYELPVQTRMGKAIRSQVVENAKLYRQMLNNVMQEVPLQSSEWHRNVETCNAWTVFMTRVFNANVEGRRAELAMQKERGHISEEELIPGLQNCWLWVRDVLTDQLKAASKGSPVMQGNSILALAGLANAIFGYQTSIEPDANSMKLTKSDVTESEYTPTQEWIASVTDTLLVILDGNLKTTGSPMNWCQQVSSVTLSTSSLLSRVCAAIALSKVVPTLLNEEFERVEQVIQVLQVRIPGQAKAGNSFVIQTYCALGMGLTLKQLYQNNFSDLTGHEGNMLLVKALDVLETAALSSELQNTEGVVYGLGLAMTSLCKVTATAVITMHIKSTYDKMVKFYERERSKESSKLQALSLAVAYTTVSLYDAGLLDEQFVLKTTLDMENVVESFSKDRDLASAFGLLVHALTISGLNSAETLFNKWTKHWESVAFDKSLSSGDWVAALFGLSALFGSEQTFFMNENSPPLSKSYLENGVKLLKQLLKPAGELTLTGNISWLLGRLWLASRSSLNSQPAVPDDLNYVGEDSVLNSLVDLLIKLGRKDIPESTETTEIINTTLRILTEGPKNLLPPVNWMNILVPLLKKYSGNKTVRLCLDFALRPMSVKSTGTFLSSWLSPSVIINLDNDCKILLYSSLEQLVRVLSTKKSNEFLQHAIKFLSNKEVDVTLAEPFLTGLHSVLTMIDLPKSIVPCIKEAVENVYRLLPNDLKSRHQILISKLAACFQHFPFGDVELLIKSGKENLTKTMALTKHLVTTNAQLFSKLVKPLVDQALSGSVVFKVLPFVVSTISCMELNNFDGFIVEWITELLSSFGSANNFSEERDLILVVLTVLLLVSNTKNDVASTILVLKQQDAFFTEVITDNCDIQHGWFSIIINLLPVALSRFLQEPNWKPLVEKVITKLLVLHNSSRKLEDSRLVLETLLELRSFEIYEERSVWTKVVSRMSTTCGTNELSSSSS